LRRCSRNSASRRLNSSPSPLPAIHHGDNYTTSYSTFKSWSGKYLDAGQRTRPKTECTDDRIAHVALDLDAKSGTEAVEKDPGSQDDQGASGRGPTTLSSPPPPLFHIFKSNAHLFRPSPLQFLPIFPCYLYATHWFLSTAPKSSFRPPGPFLMEGETDFNRKFD
jgi:hypothetical protein